VRLSSCPCKLQSILGQSPRKEKKKKEHPLLEVIIQPFFRPWLWVPERLLHAHYSFLSRFLPALSLVCAGLPPHNLSHLCYCRNARGLQAIHLSEIGDDVWLCELYGDSESCDEWVVLLLWAIPDEPEDEIGQMYRLRSIFEVLAQS